MTRVITRLRKPITYFKHFTLNNFIMSKTSKESLNASDACNRCCTRASVAPQTIKEEFQILATPVKSQSDKKEYKVIRLRNGLTACLISDPSLANTEEEYESEGAGTETSAESGDSGSETSKSSGEDEEEETESEQKLAAASLCIGVGSFSDPKAVPGMAHFLEHMVFMGSEKFPEENDFDSFISKRGGSDNASTDCETTTFYFECLEKDLPVALDKFSQFFISPLMKRGSITREREAIDSEFQMAVPSDSYRKEQLLSTFAKPESPMNTFQWGNLITLRDNVSEDELYSGVHEFRKRHYSAHRMTLAIQARLPMDVLETHVLECFSDIPSNDLPSNDFTKFTNAFDTPEFTKLYFVQPVSDLIAVELTWILPSLLDKYKSKPHQYISWILGHEGKGSLLSYLKKKVWVLALTAGNDESGSDHNSIYSMFTISMTLTQEGLDHLQEVVGIVFSYIKMMRDAGPQERIFLEIKQISDTSFKFAAEETAVEVVEELSEDMQIYPPEDYLTGSELFFEYDPQGIQKILDSLKPEKMNLIVWSGNLPAGISFDKTEKWFGTKYTQKDIPKDWLKHWKNAKLVQELSLPEPNAFLTEDFDILEEEKDHPDYPEKVLSTEIVELWYRKDQKFKLPLAYYYFYFITPLATESPKTSALTDFYITILGLLLTEEAYPAIVANLAYSFRNYDKGILLTVSGHNEKLHILVELITQHLLDFNKNLTEEMFIAVKDKMIKYYYNRLIKPSKLATDMRLYLLINKHHLLLDKYNVAPTLTFDDIKKFSEDYIARVYVKVLVQGNVRKEQAIDVVGGAMERLKCQPLEPGTYPNFRITRLPKGETFCSLESLNRKDSNSIITNYYQTGPFSLQDAAIIEVLELILQEPLFDTLRTKEQLGYDVNCSKRDTLGILAFSITVNAQATKNTTQYVESRIEEFVKQSSDLLEKMPDKTFETTKQDLIKTKRCADVHLKEETTRNWTEITDEEYMFDRIKKEIAEIEKLRIDDVRKWWKANVAKESFRKLSVQVSGFSDANQEPSTHEDGDVQDKEKKFQLKFVGYENEARFFVKDVRECKENLEVFPATEKQ